MWQPRKLAKPLLYLIIRHVRQNRFHRRYRRARIVDIMFPRQVNRRSYIVRENKWIFLFLRRTRICNRRTKLILRIIDNIIVRSLRLGNIRLCCQIIIKISVDVQVVRLNHQHHSNVRRFLQIPQLKTGQFVNNNVIFLNFRQNIQSWHANISH